jgi:hypothetical protein
VVRGKGNDLVLLTFPPRSCGGNTNCLYALQVLPRRLHAAAVALPWRAGYGCEWEAVAAPAGYCGQLRYHAEPDAWRCGIPGRGGIP